MIKDKKLFVMFVLAALFIIFTVCFFGFALHMRTEVAEDYSRAKDLVISQNYEDARQILDSLTEYKEGAQLRKLSQKGILFQQATELLKNKEYEEAISVFSNVISFDEGEKLTFGEEKFTVVNDKLIENSKEGLKHVKYNLAIRYYDESHYLEARKLFIELADYEESQSYLARINAKNRDNDNKIIYEEACAKLSEGQYEEALKDFTEILDYKDSKKKAKECKAQLKRKNLNNTMAVGVRYAIALTDKGDNKFAGDNDDGQDEFKTWKDVVSVDGYGTLVIGLRENGKIRIAGKYDDTKININKGKWKNSTFLDVAAGERFVIALTEDGSVVADGHKDDGQCDTEGWKNIVAVDAGWRFAVGLTKDGSLEFSGKDNGQKEKFLEKKGEWKDVINISASGGEPNGDKRGKGHTVGLKSDGTVVAVGDNSWGQCEVTGKDWHNIVAIAAGDWYTVGLKENGKVIITGDNRKGSYYIDKQKLKEINNKKDVVAIAAGYGQTLFLHKNGSVSTFGFDEYGGMEKWTNLIVPEIN